MVLEVDFSFFLSLFCCCSLGVVVVVDFGSKSEKL